MPDNLYEKHDFPTDLTWFDIAVCALAIVGSVTILSGIVVLVLRVFL